jgi:hypothetical protein
MTTLQITALIAFAVLLIATIIVDVLMESKGYYDDDYHKSAEPDSGKTKTKTRG